MDQSTPNEVLYSVFSIKGKRNYMEDIDLKQSINGIDIYCVFDGHGGVEIAEKVRDKICDFLPINEILSNASDSDKIKTAISDSFVELDKHIFNKYYQGCGTTASVALKFKDKLYVANLGDSRCIIFTPEGKLLLSTEDHKPKNEIERIKRAGGTVRDNRVNGVLAVSRAFGDYEFKINGNDEYMGIDSPVSPLPDITMIDITSPVIMVMGSDGLWDTVTHTQVINMSQTYNIDSLATHLVNTAYEKGSADNITVLAVKMFPDEIL
jgi:serine/threonine protein phosphatase PrpC